MRHLVSVAFLGITLAGCSDKIVYRDAPNFEEPPTGALGFLGYSNSENHQTTCGNCHSGKQAKWRETAHAGAWSTLASSGSSAKTCEGCHSVGARGNVSTDTTGGYASTHNARYEDVQCESCHGPGLTHATNPDVTTSKPLASIYVGPTLTNGCGECHSGTHQPFVEQWAASRHARVVESRSTNASCVGCHEPRGVLAAWGVKSNFIELTQTGAPYQGITCVVCHDPHDAANPKQLRFPVDAPDLQTNLCMKCHYRRAVPEVTSSSGPHSPQGPVLLGEAGWTPPNFVYPPGSLVGSHGSDRNPKLCATCHVNQYTISNAQTGSLTFRATGHSFQPIPCVDGQGVPTGSTTCTDTERSYKACTVCHLSETAARTARSVAIARLTRLADQVDSLLPRIPANQFSTTDNRITTAEGARFNSQLARQPGTPIHNPFLAEALLLASLQQIRIDYGLSPSTNISLRPVLIPPPAARIR
jgi:predicted CXXCH cytochrome family protein